MKRFFYWLANCLRPWRDDGLPDELRMPENTNWFFHKDAMKRSAALSQSERMEFGIFKILGLAYAERAQNAWQPRELLIMEDLSLAFFEVEDRAFRGIHVPDIHIDRLVCVLQRYYDYVGDSQSEETVRAKVAACLEKTAEIRRMTAEHED